MSVISYLVVALALGLVLMIQMHRSAATAPARPSARLLTVTLVAAVHSALYLIGSAIGGWLQFRSDDGTMVYADRCAYVFLGLAAVVAVRALWPYLGRRTQPAVFRLDSAAQALLMAAATGMQLLLMGIGVGMADVAGHSIHLILWPLFVVETLFGLLGMAYGRQQVKLRPRRWMAVAALLLVGVAVAAVVNAS